jgi:hypothetical protein
VRVVRGKAEVAVDAGLEVFRERMLELLRLVVQLVDRHPESL